MDPCAIVELRQYTLHPGARNTLIELFEREFVETQEAVGMTLIGQFRDADRADRFVWMRGFPDMVSRTESLSSYYEGPVWRTHREAANATMIDYDNVLLLKPLSGASGFMLETTTRAAIGQHVDEPACIVATILSFAQPLDAAMRRTVGAMLDAADANAQARSLARFETEYAENTFARLPVRTGEHVVVAFAREAPARSAAIDELASALGEALIGAPERLVLEATPRSRVR